MSDHSISIVPKKTEFPDKETKSKEIIDWLVAFDIVKPILSDRILSSNTGYTISEGAKKTTIEPDLLPFGLETNGLEIIKERKIFHTGQNGIEEIICPNCKNDIANEELDFLYEWIDDNSNSLTCPICNISTDIYQFKFTPEWGFSDFGFTFWNWPAFTESFINDFRKKIGSEVNIVYTRI